MKAAVLREGPKIILEERPISEPEHSQVVVKVHRAAVCGTDFHAIKGTYKCEYPIVLGHEFSGEIFKTGKKVEYFSEGDRVVVEGMIGCGFCRMCRRGIPHYCENGREIGFSHDGGWQEYVAVPSSNAYIIPKSVTYDEAAMIEPLNCALGAISKAKITPGDDILIIGDGPGGLFFVQLAKLFGAGRIILAGLIKERLKLAKEFGADFIINVSKESINYCVNELTNNQGADVSIEAVGIQETIRQTVDLTKAQGYAVLYGVGEGKDKAIDTDIIPLKMLTIVGDQSSHHFWDRSIDLVAKKMVNVNSMITNHFDLDDIEKALSCAKNKKDGTIKVMLDIVK